MKFFSTIITIIICAIFLGLASSASADYKDTFLGGGTACTPIPGTTPQRYACANGQLCDSSTLKCISESTNFFSVFGVTAGGMGTNAEKYGPLRFWVNGINMLLGMLGIFSVAVILFGGFKLMTAGGETDKAKSASKTVMYATMGLVVIALAWVIGYAAINSLTTMLK